MGEGGSEEDSSSRREKGKKKQEKKRRKRRRKNDFMIRTILTMVHPHPLYIQKYMPRPQKIMHTCWFKGH